MSAFDEIASPGLSEIVTRQEAWLRDICRQTGMTPEQLAERYYLEQEPVKSEADRDGATYRATQRVRLRRREVTPDKEEATDV